MPLFDEQKGLLRTLVAAANKVRSPEFTRLTTFGSDTAVFHGPGGSEQFDMGDAADGLIPSDYVFSITRERCRLTDAAFDAVARDFAPAHIPPPTPHQTNYVYNSGTIGTLSQMNVNSVERHAASEALDMLRHLLTSVPAAVANDAAEQLDAIDSELKTGTPVTAKVKASFGMAGMLLKDYGAPTAALIQAAHAVGLDGWLKQFIELAQ